jgi:DNA-directed RNA polymerase subunit H (RpoH/RPB5)
MNLDEAIYQSRMNLLSILERRGYNVSPFRKFGLEEVRACTENNLQNYAALNLMIDHATDENKKVAVFYPSSRLNQSLRVLSFIDSEVDALPLTTEVIVMIQDPPNEELHSMIAYKQFLNKRRIGFYCIYHLVINPFEHVFVPRHEKVPDDELPALMKRLRTIKTQLPIIRFHTDPIARYMGLVPGDVIKITRPSPSSGEYEIWNVCLP